MPTLFTRIIKGEIPCEKILEDERFFAFLDIRPIARGHTLVIPKIEIDSVFDLPVDYLEGMLPFAQRIAQALKKTVPCARIGMLVAGFEIPHAHLHLVPINNEGELSFSHAKAADFGELKDLGLALRSSLT